MIARSLVRAGAPAPPPGSGDDPFSIFTGWDSGQLLWLAILVPIAVLVFFVGSRRFRAQLGSSALVPRGRDRFVPGSAKHYDAAWAATVERLRERPASPIAKAQSGPVRIEGEIVRATGNLGGPPGRECVWRNRAGAGSQTAVAAELLIVADDTGRCGVESLETARVIAPVDKTGTHYESTSLRLGDRVEVVAHFEREVFGEHEDPAQLVYGTLGIDGRIGIRVLHRPEPPPPPDEPSQAPDDES